MHPARDLEDETGLADSRLAFDEHHHAAAGEYFPDATEDQLLLVAPADERQRHRSPEWDPRADGSDSDPQPRCVGEHVAMQLAQVVARLDAELRDHSSAIRVERAQRIDLPTTPVEREQVLRTQPLAPRFGAKPVFDRLEDLDVTARVEQRVIAQLVHRHP